MSENNESSADESSADESSADESSADESSADENHVKPQPKDKAKWPYVAGACVAVVAIYFAAFHRSGSASEVEAYLLERAGEDLGAERLEDVEDRRVWRVDLVQLDGLDSLSEALVDFDRDERYDERWEFFTDGRIRRHHSSDDDGRYDVVEMRVGEEWVAANTPTAEGLPEDVEQAIGSVLEATSGNTLGEEEADRAADDGVRSQAEIWLLTQQGRSLRAPLERDAREGVPWYVDLYQEDGSTTITGALLDLDRDGQPDQRWTYEGEERVVREVSSSDNSVYDEVSEWSDEGWREVDPPSQKD